MNDRWWHEMACRDADPGIFEEPVRVGRFAAEARKDTRWAEEPLALCHRCPVRLQCLHEHLNTPVEPWPIRAVVGGLLPDQLDELRRRGRKSA